LGGERAGEGRKPESRGGNGWARVAGGFSQGSRAFPSAAHAFPTKNSVVRAPYRRIAGKPREAATGGAFPKACGGQGLRFEVALVRRPRLP